MKKFLALVMVLALAVSMVACGGAASSTVTSQTGSSAAAATGSVYYLNFKPEAADQWVELAKQYTAETGVEVNVVTAASGTYEDTLKSEIAKTEAPTLFQVNGPVGLANWKDYCYDLSNSAIYDELTSKDFGLMNGSEVAGIGYVVETYGLIYNKTLLAKAGYDAADITTFAKLKEVADDIQARKDELGVKGAFASAGMDSSSDWRFKTHLANLPIYYEYKADGIGDTQAIKGSYLDNYKNIWDLYITDATCEPALLSSKTGDDALSEFVLGEAVFYQNGTWAYGDIQKAGTLTDEEIGMMPIYIGAEGEENQGLCTGTENYWCVNKNAKAEDIQATLDFMNWVVTSDAGRKMMSENIGVCPFKGFTGEYQSSNPFVLDDAALTAAGKSPVAWCFTTMPSEEWKNGVGSALLEYSQGTGDWDAVVSAFVDGWATEKAA